MIGTNWVALTYLTTRGITDLFKCQSVPKKASFAHFAMGSIRVINTTKALASRIITIANGVFIHILVAVTFLTWPDWSIITPGIKMFHKSFQSIAKYLAFL
jgi:hypothetical protein